MTARVIAGRAGRREWTGLAVITLPCLVYAMDLTVLGGTGELAQLNSFPAVASMAFPAPMLAAIDGMARVGKTALAVHWAHQVAGQFPGRTALRQPAWLWPQRGGDYAGEALRKLLEALGLAVQHTPMTSKPGLACTGAC